MTAIVSFQRYYNKRAQVISFDQLSARDVVILPNTQKSQLFLADKKLHIRDATQALPAIISLNQWLSQIYLFNNSSTRKPLPAYHQLLFWHTVVRQHSPDLTDTQCWTMAQSYQSHYQQTNQQQLPTDESHYQHCLSSYQQMLTEENVIDHVSIASNFSAMNLTVSHDHYVFTAFTELTDQLKVIIDALPTNCLRHLPPYHTESNIAQMIADDAQIQRDFVVHLCQSHLDDPTSGTLGLVVPDVGSAQEFETITEEICRLTRSTRLHEDCLSSTLTSSLSDQPLIQTFTTLLHFFDNPTREAGHQLLLWPVLHQPDIPTSAYHLFCQSLCDISLARWPDHPFFSVDAPDPIHRIADFCRLLLAPHPNQPMLWHEWQAWFRNIIVKLIGNYQPHTSQDAHLYQAWLQAIRDQPCPPWMSGPISYKDWLMATKRYLARSPYRPVYLSRIRILTWSQALGVPHQKLVFLSHHAGTWPPDRSSDPAHDDVTYWRDIFTQLRQSCDDFTIVRLAHDSQSQPLLAAYQTADIPASTLSDQRSHPYFQLPDQRVPTSVAVFGDAISGHEQRISTAVIDAYSQCFAQGFLSHRLHIRPPQPKPYGLVAADIGTLIHEVLSHVDHVTSDDLPDHAVIRDQVQKTVLRHRCCRYLTDGQRITLGAHLERSVLEWVSYRVTAHQDDTISHCQHEVCIDKTLFGMQFTVRLDRVDYFPDGSCRIIDYKTGLTNRSAWLQDPPQSPQLVVYALCQPKTRAIAFASLHPDHLGYSGYGSQSDLTGIKPITEIILSQPDTSDKVYNNWPTQMALWEKSVARLVAHYREGALHKNPVNGSATCQYCQLQSACRYYEQPVLEPAS